MDSLLLRTGPIVARPPAPAKDFYGRAGFQKSRTSNQNPGFEILRIEAGAPADSRPRSEPVKIQKLAAILLVAILMPPTLARTRNNIPAQTAPAAAPQLAQADAVLISEAVHLWKSLGDSIWPGWTRIASPILYITADYEYAVGFPKALPGFQAQAAVPPLAESIQVRPRSFSPNLAAAFPFEGVPAAVIGRPEALERTPTHWVLTAVHEMFHVLQMHRGEFEKVAALTLGPRNDASWQLNFPFPYQNPDVMDLIHLQSYLNYLAAGASDMNDINYDAGTAIEALRVYQSVLKRLAEDDRNYRYSLFQEWKEGIALYTEYKMAEAAASADLPLGEAFLKLPGAQTFRQIWDERYKNTLFLAKHAGRASRSRIAFYHLGLGKGLLLDRLLPVWKDRYFAPGVWLDDLLAAALGKTKERPDVSVGAPAPAFELPALAGGTVSLKDNAGRVLLLSFWQTWCPPCVAEIPSLNALAKKYESRGLRVFGITDRLNADGIEKVRQLAKDAGMAYPALIDEKGETAGRYDIGGYPQVYLIGRDGLIAYKKLGFVPGDEAVLEEAILKALQAGK
jgi:peroxiredoxin